MADHLSVFRLRVAAGDVFDADPLTDSKSVWTITPVVFNDGVDGVLEPCECTLELP